MVVFLAPFTSNMFFGDFNAIDTIFTRLASGTIWPRIIANRFSVRSVKTTIIKKGFEEAGIEDVGIVVGDTAEAVEQAVGDGSKFGLNVTYIPQEAPLGLAHAVKISKNYMGSESFVMYLGDNLLKNGIKSFVNEFEIGKYDSQILLAKVPNPTEFGVAEVVGDRGGALARSPVVFRIFSRSIRKGQTWPKPRRRRKPARKPP